MFCATRYCFNIVTYESQHCLSFHQHCGLVSEDVVTVSFANFFENFVIICSLLMHSLNVKGIIASCGELVDVVKCLLIMPSDHKNGIFHISCAQLQ